MANSSKMLNSTSHQRNARKGTVTHYWSETRTAKLFLHDSVRIDEDEQEPNKTLLHCRPKRDGKVASQRPVTWISFYNSFIYNSQKHRIINKWADKWTAALSHTVTQCPALKRNNLKLLLSKWSRTKVYNRKKQCWDRTGSAVIWGRVEKERDQRKRREEILKGY